MLSNPARYRWEPFAAFAILIAVCAKIFWGLKSHVDIVGGDDAMYLNLSRSLQELKPDFGPIYVVWLKVLTLSFGDPIDAYYFNLAFMSVFPALAFFIFLKRAGYASSIAMLVSGLFLCSGMVVHFSWNTNVGHLAAALLFLWLAAIIKEKDPLIIVLAGALAALIVSYVRPEFFLAFVALSGFWILLFGWRHWKKRLNWSRRLRNILIGFLLACTLLLVFVGVPLGHDASRSVVAIFQHIIYNYALRHDIPHPFMESFNMTEYWKMFAGVSHITDEVDLNAVLKRNMPEIKAHLAFNFLEYWRGLYQHISEILLPGKIFFNISAWGKWLIIVVAIVGVNLARKRNRLTERLSKYGWIVFTLLIICGPGIAFSFLIFPRQHYLMAQMPFYLAIIFLLLIPAVGNLKNEKTAFILLGILLLIFAPTISRFTYEKIWGPYKKVTLVHDIKAIRSLPIFDRKITFMERETNMAAFLKGNCPVYFPYKEDAPFQYFIDTSKIDLILVSDAMYIDRRYKNDSSFHSFIKSDYRKDWRKFTVNASGDDIYVRKALLPVRHDN